MTYNVFGETLSLTKSINQLSYVDYVYLVIASHAVTNVMATVV